MTDLKEKLVRQPFYISFGSSENQQHLIHGHTTGLNMVLKIKAYNESIARAIAFYLFGDKFSMIYSQDTYNKSERIKALKVVDLE